MTSAAVEIRAESNAKTISMQKILIFSTFLGILSAESSFKISHNQAFTCVHCALQCADADTELNEQKIKCAKCHQSVFTQATKMSAVASSIELVPVCLT